MVWNDFRFLVVSLYISYAQGWPMIYWLGNACCCKISWPLWAFQTCLKAHDSSQCTCSVRPLQCPSANRSYLQMCNVFSRYLAHSWYYHKSLNRVSIWKEPGSQKHELWECWRCKETLIPFNTSLIFQESKHKPCEVRLLSHPTNRRFCGYWNSGI